MNCNKTKILGVIFLFLLSSMLSAQIKIEEDSQTSDYNSNTPYNSESLIPSIYSSGDNMSYDVEMNSDVDLENTYKIWEVDLGILLHHSASISTAKSKFSVEFSGDNRGYYTMVFVYFNRDSIFSDVIDVAFTLEVYDKSNSLYYNDSGFFMEVAGMPGVYILLAAEQVFQMTRQHPWFMALREGYNLKLYKDEILLDEFTLSGSNNALTRALEKSLK